MEDSDLIESPNVRIMHNAGYNRLKWWPRGRTPYKPLYEMGHFGVKMTGRFAF